MTIVQEKDFIRVSIEQKANARVYVEHEANIE